MIESLQQAVLQAAAVAAPLPVAPAPASVQLPLPTLGTTFLPVLDPALAEAPPQIEAPTTLPTTLASAPPPASEAAATGNTDPAR